MADSKDDCGGGGTAAVDDAGTGAGRGTRGSKIPQPTAGMKQVPRLQASDPEVARRVAAQLPVVIVGSDLAKPAVNRWTPEYLLENVTPEPRFTIYRSRGRFLYWDATKNEGGWSFKAPSRSTDSTFSQFMDDLAQAEGDVVKAAEEAAAGSPRAVPPERVYLQTALFVGMGDAIQRDVTDFNWKFLLPFATANKWGPLTTNLLLVGQSGIVTPAHYDEQENFFAQLYGYKRFLLLHPAHFKGMYPFPVGHPADRQAQVNILEPDLERFPNFAGVREELMECIVQPGDVLYIPLYWWHHVEGSWGRSVSVTFWFKCRDAMANLVLPVESPFSLLAVRRNIERFVCTKVGYDTAAAFFAKVSRGDALTAEEGALMQLILSMLSAVLPPAQCQPFFTELVTGRFPPLKGVDH